MSNSGKDLESLLEFMSGQFTRRVHTDSHMDVVADAVIADHKKAETLKG